MKTTLALIEAAATEHPNGAVAISGGTDSTVLLDIIYRLTQHRPPIIYADDQMGYPETLPHVRALADRYGADVHVARAKRSPTEQWAKQGWPMLGKLAARKWMQKHRNREMGFRLDVSSCCRNMKIAPARRLARKLGCTLQYTGQRGNVDDALRGLRAIKDGAIHHIKSDKLTVCNPLLGWTDTMIRRYMDRHQLPVHPARQRGAITIGCLYCGGGAQFTNSGLRILRAAEPARWRWFIVEAGAGEIVLAIKYDQPLPIVRAALGHLGGLAAVADARPWVFDYLRRKPMQGYTK